MTKQEFVERVASKGDLDRRTATKAVDAFIDAITDALRSGEEISFTGFGKFTTQQRAERQGVNPRNPSQKVTIPAARVPKFSAGSSLKQAVRGGGDGAYRTRALLHDFPRAAATRPSVLGQENEPGAPLRSEQWQSRRL